MAKSNRAKRRKESKRIEEVISEDSNFMDKFFIVSGVILFLLCFYILTVYITNKNTDSDNKNNTNTVEVSDDQIILGRSLSMGKGDYYVVYYTVDNTTMAEIVNNYNGELPLYKVNMSDAFNSKYSTDGESNKNPSKVSEFKVNGPTLIKVSNKKVVDYIEGEESIRTNLN